MGSMAPGMGGMTASTPRSARAHVKAASREMQATIPSITPQACGLGPRVEELQTIVKYQLNLSKQEAEGLVQVEKKDDSEEKVKQMKMECAAHLQAKRDIMKQRGVQQRQEMQRLQRQIGRIKDEHCKHQQDLLGLQRRVGDTETYIGD